MRSAVDIPHGLENGAVMDRETFHRLYSASPELHRVELIEGVVYRPSRISLVYHAAPHGMVIQWLIGYTADRPEAQWSPPATLLLDDRNEPEPDVMLYRRLPGRIVDGYLVGAPELAIEIANTSASRDLHQKKRAYERNGVLEYIVWRVRDSAIDWFTLRDGAYHQRSPDPTGIIESEVFPGLRLDVEGMLAMDRARVLAALRS